MVLLIILPFLKMASYLIGNIHPIHFQVQSHILQDFLSTEGDSFVPNMTTQTYDEVGAGASLSLVQSGAPKR